MGFYYCCWDREGFAKNRFTLNIVMSMKSSLYSIKLLWQQNKSLFIIVLLTSLMAGNAVGYISYIPAWKYILAAGLWYAVLCFPYKSCSLKQYYDIDKSLIKILAILAFISIFSVPFRDDSFIYESNASYGNKYISWLVNPLSIFMFYPLLYLTIQSNVKYVKEVFLALFVSVVFCVFFSFFSQYYENHIFFFLPLLYPIYKYNKVLFGIAVIFFLLKATAVLGLARVHTLYFIFAVIAYFCCIKFKSNHYVKYAVIIIILLPLFYALKAYLYGESVFSLLEEASKEKGLNQDTRTFLYEELFLDLHLNNDFMFGKGCHSFYFSDFFDTKNFLAGYRNGVEVPVLNWLLKAGFIYCLIYLILFIRAIYFSIWHSKSWFLKTCGILLAGDFFLQFVGDMIGPYFFQIMIWTMMGMGLSNYWRNLSDNEIKNIIIR